MEGVSVAGGFLANNTVLLAATIWPPGLSCVWSADSLSQVLLSLYLPLFTSACFIFRAVYD